MGRLVYSAIASLDGYVADSSGGFEWAAPDEQVHAMVNDQERAVGTYLYGRRMYEVMVAWESMDTTDEPAVMQDYAQIWRSATKVVYSRTLTSPSSSRTRIEQDFDPAAVHAFVTASEQDVSVGGPGLAAHALAAGIVDDLHLFVSPVVVGGGTAALPDGVRLPLVLVDEHRFDGGVVHLHYHPKA